jgi:hypothetical protein
MTPKKELEKLYKIQLIRGISVILTCVFVIILLLIKTFSNA